MAFIKKNIWVLFYTITALSLLAYFFIAFYLWQSVVADKQDQLKAEVNRLSGGYQAMLTNKDTILQTVGQSLVNHIDFDQGLRAHHRLNQLVSNSPDIGAIALVTSSGHPSFASANVNRTLITQFIQREAIGAEFSALLSHYPLWLGKTTYSPDLEEWVIPLYKTIRDDEGYTDGIIVGLMRTQTIAEVMNHPSNIEPSDSIHILDEEGISPQYGFSGKTGLYQTYEEDTHSDFFSAIRQAVQEQQGIDTDEVAYTGKTVPFSATHNGVRYIGVLAHINTFDQWLVARTPQNAVFQHYLYTMGLILLGFVVVDVLLFYLFHVIATSENKKRMALTQQAFHDELTALPNRNYLFKHIDQWINDSLEPFTLFYVDMDRFKNVNDNFGHLFGDQVLKIISARIKHILPPNAEVIRYGGDEFLVFIKGSDPDVMRQIARKACDRLSERYVIYSVSLELGCSIGIARYPEDGQDFDALVRASDLAMYEAKKDRNTVRFFAENMLYERQRKIEIEHHLKNAVANNEIFIVYQPQITKTGSVTGVESLVRWHNKELGPVPPDQFIPIAESSGLMPKLGQHILNAAMREMADIQHQTGLNFTTSINVSLRQFMHEDFMQSLQLAIQENNVNNLCIVLEITENLFIDDIEYIYPLLTQIREMGMQVSMDDFGTGYSSLNILSSLPIDELKIDKSFVDNIIEDDSARKMTKNIISIGKTYNMLVVAEGVETKEQYELLKTYDCDHFQGYYFSKPLLASDLLTYLRDSNNSA